MKCREFRKQVLERRRIPEPGAFEAHASECSRCARLREDEHLATGALIALRQASAADRASPQTEERLLAEFRNRGRSKKARTFQINLETAWPWLVVAAAAVFAVSAVMWQPGSQGNGTPVVRTSAPPATAIPANETKPQVVAGSPGRLPAGPRVAGESGRAARTQRISGTTGARPIVLGRPAALAARSSGRDRGATALTREPRPAVATEFFPTMRLAGSEPGTDLQLVRIPVSRRTLEGFGLSVDPRLGNRPVKADVLIGPDGLTRAVRFISEQE